MLTDKRRQVLGLGTEAEGYRKFEKKTDMEIAEVCLNTVQQEDILFAPLEKALFCRSVLHHTVEDLAQEHCHRVFEDIVAYSQKRVSGDNITSSEQV